MKDAQTKTTELTTTVFDNNTFGRLTVLTIKGELWFIGKEVASVLGYTNSRKALKDHIDIEDKVVTKCYSLGGKQNTTIINESGLYSLILSSKLPSAKQFKRWVTSEVLPSIRKRGVYSTNETVQSNKIIKDFTQQISEANVKIAELVDKVSETQTIDTFQMKQLDKARKNRIYELIPDKVDQREYYAGFLAVSINDFKKHFGLTRWTNLPAKDYTAAYLYIKEWAPRNSVQALKEYLNHNSREKNKD